MVIGISLQIACRSSKKLEPGVTEKISMFCHVAPEQVLAVHDVSSVYHVPILLQQQNVLETLRKRLNLDAIPVTPERLQKGQDEWNKWQQLTVA